MPLAKKILIAVLTASLGVSSALALAACSDDDITADADEQVEVVLREFDISPQTAEVREGSVEFVAQNDGTRLHELAIESAGEELERSGEIDPGQSGGFTIDLAPGRYRIYDPRSNYRDRGMQATVVVTAEGGTVTERTVERTVVEEDPEVEEPEVQEPEVQEPEVQEPDVQPPPPPVVTQTVPAPPPAQTTTSP